MIPYGKHSIDQQDIDAVVTVLEQEFLTQGQQVPAFEQELCDYTQARYGVAVNSGTSGLHIACLAAGISSGDIVWTSPNSFAASANCALYCGATVDFVDIDPATFNMCPHHLATKLAHAAQVGQLPKAIVVVHFSGASCDMKAIATLTAHYNITLIEDAAHGLGASDAQGNKVGACRYSDMAVLSFHPVKSITSAEGGAVLTNSAKLADALRLFASHGITKQPGKLPGGHTDEPWFYAQVALGFNYRLSDLHAALGRSQLRKLDAFVSARRSLVERYLHAFAQLPVDLPVWDSNSAWHLFMLVLNGQDRTHVFNQLRQQGLAVNVHYIPIHTHPYYQQLGFKKGDFPNSEFFYQNAITLPLFPDLTADMQDKVISIVGNTIR